MSIKPVKTTILNLCLVWSSLLCLGGTSSGAAELPESNDSVVAIVDGQPIRRSALESHGSGRLLELDKQRHQVLESSLTQLVQQRLLELEAKARSMGVGELVHAEVTSKVPGVTEADIDAFYTQNQARMRGPKESVSDQIRSHLERQRDEPIRREFLNGLRQRYGVQTLLEPLRLEFETANAPFKGPRDAAVTVSVFSDFECPFCSRLLPALHRLEEVYSERVRFTFHQLPLRSIHKHAQKAAEASVCAAEQGKFWPMHDAIFAHQKELAVDDLKTRAAEVGLDQAAFDTCLDSDAASATVQADVDAAAAIGLTGTPVVFVNGRDIALLRGVDPFDLVSTVIEDEFSRVTSR